MNGVYCLYFRLVLISLNTPKLVYISILKHIITVDRNYCLVFQIRHHHYQNRIKFSNYLFLFKIPLFLTNKREPSYSTSAPHSSSTKWIMYFHFSKNCNWIASYTGSWLMRTKMISIYIFVERDLSKRSLFVYFQ